jgi:hypothetical protein
MSLRDDYLRGNSIRPKIVSQSWEASDRGPVPHAVISLGGKLYTFTGPPLGVSSADALDSFAVVNAVDAAWALHYGKPAPWCYPQPDGTYQLAATL